MSKINKKTDNELKQTIIVLDDPVTSFDDDRIDQTIIKIQELIEKNKQIIILAHHSNFLKQLYGTLKKNDKLEMLFYEIIRNQDGSKFSKVEDPNIRFDPYAQKIEKLIKFIKGEDSLETEIRQFLRVFLETEIKWRYRKQIREKNINVQKFGELIEKLKKNKIVSKPIAQKLFNFNALPLLSQEHHTILSSTAGNSRSIANQIFDFIFTKINPDPNI